MSNTHGDVRANLRKRRVRASRYAIAALIPRYALVTVSMEGEGDRSARGFGGLPAQGIGNRDIATACILRCWCRTHGCFSPQRMLLADAAPIRPGHGRRALADILIWRATCLAIFKRRLFHASWRLALKSPAHYSGLNCVQVQTKRARPSLLIFSISPCNLLSFK
jgi:hypothetical protein